MYCISNKKTVSFFLLAVLAARTWCLCRQGTEAFGLRMSGKVGGLFYERKDAIW